MRKPSQKDIAESPSLREGLGAGKVVFVRKNLPYSEKQLTNARFLRKNSTVAERKLWSALRENRVVTKLKFRRQYPIGPYIADFYCHEYKCVIEVDGISHDLKTDYDQERDRFMKCKGIKVFRFTDDDVRRDPNMIIETILLNLDLARP